MLRSYNFVINLILMTTSFQICTWNVITSLHSFSHIGFLPKFVKRLKDMKFLREDLVFSVHSTEVITYFQFSTCHLHAFLLVTFFATFHFELVCFFKLELLNFQYPFWSYSLLLKFKRLFRCTRAVYFVLFAWKSRQY